MADPVVRFEIGAALHGAGGDADTRVKRGREEMQNDECRMTNEERLRRGKAYR